MADRDENEFLDDLDALEAEFDEQEEAEPTEEELEADALAVMTAERDEELHSPARSSSRAPSHSNIHPGSRVLASR